MARKKKLFAALIYWFLDVSFSQNGCSINNICDSSKHDCLTTENVALGKTAEISTSLNSPQFGTSGAACVVVNGKRDNWVNGGYGDDANCAHTNESDYTGWWQVHLGRNYTIQNISIYSQDRAEYRLSEVRITIDGDVCYDFPSTYTGNSIINIQCNTTVTGSTVKFEKRRRAANDAYFLVLCEVEIWVCRPGLYGPSCSNRCNCKNNDTCDNYYGTCPNVCPDYSYGFNCSSQCGHCLRNGTCNTTTGECHQGCDPGWTTVFCNQKCQTGWFGESCSQMCINCADSQSCHRFTGLCDAGCLAGWESPNCSTHLSSTEGTSTAIIIGVLVPFVVVLIVVAVVIFILRRIRRKRKQNTTSGLVELPVIPKECITPSQSQVVTKDTEDISETLNNYDTLQTGTPEKSIYSALTSRECGSVTKEDPCYYNT